MEHPWTPGWSPRGEMVIPESACDQYHRIVKVLAFVAEYIRGDAKPLDAANGVFNQDSDA